jgi:hypothetical protein
MPFFCHTHVVGEGDQRPLWWITRSPEIDGHKDMVQAESRPWTVPLRRPEVQHWRLWDTREPQSGQPALGSPHGCTNMGKI